MRPLPASPALASFAAVFRNGCSAVLVLLAMWLAAPACAQYVFLDTDGDGSHTVTDLLAPTGTTMVHVYVTTNQNADGSPAACASNDGILSISGSSIVLQATNGTVTWGPVVNELPSFDLAIGTLSNESEVEFGFYGGTSLQPGTYKVATIPVTIATGTPSIGFLSQGTLDTSRLTSFTSACSGVDLDNVIKLGSDFTGALGIGYGGVANHPPVLAAIPDVTMGEGEIRDVPVSASDADGDVITLSIRSGPSWASLLSSPGPGTSTGTVHLAPNYDVAGDSAVFVGAEDAVSRDVKYFFVHVTNTNRAPVIDPIAAMNLAEGVLLDTPIQATDPDGDAGTFFVANGPLFLTVTTLSSSFGTTFGNLHAAPGFADAGSYDVVIAVRDPSGAADSTHYAILVRDQDRPPVVTFPASPINGTEGEPITFLVTATDADGDMVMYQADGLPAGAQLTDQMNSTALFRWTPGFDQAGSYTIMIMADDMNSGMVHGEVTINVADVTDPVAIARPDDMTVIEGDAQDQPLLGFSAGGAALTFEKVSGPAYVTVSTTDAGAGAAHGLVHVAPGPSDGGNATVTLAVTDGTNRDETTFSIHVVDAASLPGQAPFQPPFIHLGVGLIPHTVIAADMNEDGIPDLVTANVGSNTLTIYPGLGNLTYGVKINLPTMVRPHTVVAKDLNHDGHLDLAVSHIGSNSFGVFLGHGNGTFEPRRDVQLTGSPVYLGVYDFNEDGIPDVVATDQTHGGIGIALGVGDGTFATTQFVATAANAHGLNGADLNHDGHMDLAVTNSTTPGTVSVLLGKGDGTFQPKIDFATSSPHTVSSGDLDKDGDVDLVICNFDTGRITIALGNGDGTFATLPEIPTGTNPHAGAVGDVDLDGNLDILVANQGSATVSVILGRGGASWAPKIDYPVGAGAHNIAIADLDGDHLPDVACSNIVANTVTILKNRGQRTHPARVFAFGPRAQLLLRAGGPDYALHVEPADGSFAPTDIDLASVQLIAHGAGSVDHIGASTKGMTTTDADQNGIMEAVIGFARGDLRLLLSNVSGRKSVEVTLQGRLADGSSFSGNATLDVIGSGAPGKPVASASIRPNPLNPAGILAFTLTRSEMVTIRIYDARGRLARRVLEPKPLEAGSYRIPVEGVTDRGVPLATGLYFFKITTRDGDVSGRFAVLK